MDDETPDFISQREAEVRLGVPSGVMAGWRKRKAGPNHVMFDHQEGYRYQRDQVEELAAAISTLRGFGVVLHGVAAPAYRPVSATYERDEPTTTEAKVITRLGISKRILQGWGQKGTGPRRLRSHPKQPWQFVKCEVERVRAALLVLGSYSIGLPGVAPLTLTDAFLVSTE